MEKLYTPQEVAEILGFAVKTIQNYISAGKINAVKVLGSNRVTQTELDKIIYGDSKDDKEGKDEQ